MNIGILNELELSKIAPYYHNKLIQNGFTHSEALFFVEKYKAWFRKARGTDNGILIG